MQRKHLKIVGVFAIAGLALCLGAVATQRALDDEVQISLADAPQAVQATLMKEAGAAEITEIEREVEDGQTVYSAEVMIDGQEVEFEIAPDGTLLGKEVEDEDDN